MAQPRFSIGIDLGTSNSALAFVALAGDERPEVLAIPQWDGPASVAEDVTLPSTLYRPDEATAAQIRAAAPDGGDWIVGRLARRKAGETPGRVVASAKSWLCHHGADRTAAFLPWGSDELPPEARLSPVDAAALVLGHLRGAWDQRFSPQGADSRFDAQDITITVPASFDVVAQRLTLDAARAAGFPERTRLLEEPQAAFIAWLDRHESGDLWAALPDPDAPHHHVLVVDVGGGTTDFSLFELNRDAAQSEPGIRRVAVSDHILLGGDNIDLAIAHLLEPRLTQGLVSLSGGQWDHLVASCRALKERALGSDGEAGEIFSVSVPGRGSGLVAAALTATLNRGELESLLHDGFFPACGPDARPARSSGALKEWGLPYAADPAISHHLADFLRDRPAVDAVLFNGGSLHPARLRASLRQLIGGWQGGRAPLELENERLDLAVALGAASHGRQLTKHSGRIEAGAARAVFLEVHGAESASLVCLLPHGAATDRSFDLAGLDLHLRLNRPVRFCVHTSTRHERCAAGDIVAPDPEVFQQLPPLETTAQAPGAESEATIPVALEARINALGLLQVSCRSLDPAIAQTWPLAFDLRPQGTPAIAPLRAAADPGIDPKTLAAAAEALTARFTHPARKGEKIAAPKMLQGLETIIGRPRAEWSAPLLRALWPSLEAAEAGRALSVEHEEAWLGLAGFLLRPGFGVAHDEGRVDALWRIHAQGLRFPGKRIRVQEHLLWRRLAGGLSRERQEHLLAAEGGRIAQTKGASPELIRMLGAFERLGPEAKTELVRHLLDTATALMAERKHCAPHLAALGGLLNRTPLFSGPEAVVPPAVVERVFEALKGFDWADPDFAEVQVLFLRAARATQDRRIDLPLSLRQKIAIRLEKSGVSAARTRRVREIVPVERDEVLGQYGDDLPPGLILAR